MMEEDRSLRWRKYHFFTVIVYTSICLDINSVDKRKEKINNHKITLDVNTTIIFLNTSHFNHLCLWARRVLFLCTFLSC